MIKQVLDWLGTNTPLGSWLRRHGFLVLGFMLGVWCMATFWKECKTVVEMRGHTMEEFRDWIKWGIGIVAPIVAAGVYGGSAIKDKKQGMIGGNQI